jgi:uncharacterized protein (DUF2237 family)
MRYRQTHRKACADPVGGFYNNGEPCCLTFVEYLGGFEEN